MYGKEKEKGDYLQTGQAGCGCGVYRFGQKNSTLITLASTGAIYRRNT